MSNPGPSTPSWNSLRPPRSRKDRPCDACRKRKHSCLITIRGEPCAYCKRSNRECRFDMPPRGRPGGSEWMRKNREDGGRSESEVSLGSQAIKPIMAMWNTAPPFDDEDPEDGDEEWHPSLDLSTNPLEESHFLGASAVQDFLLLAGHALPTGTSPLGLRQVSQDPRHNAFFIRNPAFFYGGGGTEIMSIFQRIVVLLGAHKGELLLQRFLKTSLPAFPILNSFRLIAACSGQQDAGPMPHALLCGIIGHCITYEFDLRPHFKAVWKEAIAAEDAEYKQPRLQTLQLALISLTTRPSQAHTVNAMTLARSVAVAHILGLHVDCSEWKLPRWERSVRKRVWWALMVQDKWIAIVHGRPSLINRLHRSVPLPTLDDTDWGEFQAQDEDDSSAEDSMASFIGQCELALVIESMLDGFYTPRPQVLSDSLALEDLNDLSTKLDALQARMPNCLVWKAGQRRPDLATGIRCFQMTFLGVRVLVARLYVASHLQNQAISGPEARSISLALDVCGDFVAFIEDLDPETDYGSFWLPHCSFLLSTTLGLLLSLSVRLQPDPSRNVGSTASRIQQFFEKSSDLVWRLALNLKQAKTVHHWEVAETAMTRGNELLRSVAGSLPNLAALAEESVEATSPNQQIAFDLAGWIADFTQ